MKKFLLSVLAIAGLVACHNEEIVSVQKGNPIAFDSFVENATRVGYDSWNLDGFDVWAFMDNINGVILEDEDVTRGENGYTYTNTQYWIPGHTYYFAALAPMNSQNVIEHLATGDDALKGLGTVEFTNVDGTEDLLYAATAVDANDNQGTVNFKFDHLLSKVRFSFANTFANDNYSIQVRNIEMTAPKTGTIDLTADEYTWDSHAGELTLAFGDTDKVSVGGNEASKEERLTIPADANQEYMLTFDVDLFVGDATAPAKTYNKKSLINGIVLEAGKAYNFVAQINAETLALDEIVFDAEVNEWGTGSGAPQFEPYFVEVNGVNYDNFADAVAIAMESNKPVKFFQHVAIDADTTIAVPAGKTLTLNLNGYTLTGVTDQTGANRDMFDVRGTMIVDGAPLTRAAAEGNGCINIKHIGNDMGWGCSTNVFNVTAGGVLTLENVNAKNLGGSAMAFVAHLNNWGECTLNVNNSTLESTYIAVRVFNSGPDMNNVTIANTELKGKYCFWVHNYQAAGDDAGTDDTLNLNIYNPDQNNTFTYTSKAPVLFGFNNPIYFDAEGIQLTVDVAGLQAALYAAPENATTVITLGANIEADVTDIQKPGRKVVIDGRGYKYNGTIKVHGNSEHYTDAALTIKNLNFETSTAEINCIEALENGSERYSCNITVENCTFTATGEAVNTAVGVQIKASKDAKVIGCTATNMHSLIQAQSCDESVLVQNCEVVNGKNGVAFKQVKAATVEGTTITALEYGIRFDGNIDNYGITVKNNTVTAVQPFIVRKMTGKDNTITLEGTNTLTTTTTTGTKYQIVITNGSDDETYVAPTGTYTLTGADNYTIFPEPFSVASWDEFTAALAAGETDIKLTADITYDSNYQLQKSVILNLGGYSMTLPMINIHTKTTIKNGTINGKVYARKNSEIVFNNVKFSGQLPTTFLQRVTLLSRAAVHYTPRIACSLQHLFLAHRPSLFHLRVVAAL